MNNRFRDNTLKSRYELDVEGQAVFADYRKSGDKVHILHVEAPPALRGKGAAGEFMQAMMEWLVARKLKAVPVCSYAVAWLARHPEFSDNVAER